MAKIEPYGVVKIQLGMPIFTTLTAKQDVKLGRFRVREGDKFYITNYPREQVKDSLIQIHRIKQARIHIGFFITLQTVLDFFVAEDYESCLTKQGREERSTYYVNNE
jgi:hypothetical protein